MKGEIHQAILETARELPRQFAADLIRKKLLEVDVPPEQHMLDTLVDQLMAATDDVIEWQNGGNHFKFIITADDVRDLDEALNKFTQVELRAWIDSIVEDSAKLVVRSLAREWQCWCRQEQESVRGFQQRLEDRWARPLAWWRMLHTVCRELGDERYSRFLKSRAKLNRRRDGVLLRLHVRGCQVASEIDHLLAGGFADGAMARWRTLHEISVVASLIREHGDELAERYLEHDVVQTKKIIDVYGETYHALGYRSFSKRQIASIGKLYAKALAKYGPDFRHEYGWAASISGKPKPSFLDLEAAANRAHMRSHYKMASHNVHAGIKGLTFKLGAPIGGSPIIGGASNVGLEEPGQNTAITMALLTITLLGPSRIADDLVKMKVITDLRDKAVSSFLRTGRRLDKDILVHRD